MRNVLVTGAGGFVGRALVADLVSRKFGVRAMVRSGSAAPRTEGAEYIEIDDIAGISDWPPLLAGIDAIVHLAARAHIISETMRNAADAYRNTNVLAVERLARAAVSSVSSPHLIFVSTIGVTGRPTSGVTINEKSPPSPQDLYSQSKWEAEQVLQDLRERQGLRGTTIRPPLVYGPGVPGNFLRLCDLVRRGWPIPIASVNNRRSMVFVHNLTDAIINCIEKSGVSVDQTYVISDGEDISTKALVIKLAKAMGKKILLPRFPVAGLRLIARTVGRSKDLDRLVESLVVDSTYIRNHLGWQPPVSLDDGLNRTVNWYLNSVGA